MKAAYGLIRTVLAGVLALGAWKAQGAATTGAAHLVNISARAQTGGVAGTPVTGFVVSGKGSKRMLLRAVGPGLAPFKVTGFLEDPSFQLYADGVVSASNDDWAAVDASVMNAVGAFALASSSRDAALVKDLAPGIYTAPVTSDTGSSGISLLEAYDASTTTYSYLSNASVRAYVGTGDSILVPGFVVSGSGSLRLLVRAAGPALAAYGVSGVLADPQLTVQGSDGTVVASNDNWSSQAGAAELVTVANSAGAFPFAQGSKDAAVLLSLPAGGYTVSVSGVGAGTGAALVELYAVGAGSSSAFNMAQTLSDQAQVTTLAFSGLAMLTGNLESQSFFPPGKVADYTGF